MFSTIKLGTYIYTVYLCWTELFEVEPYLH